MANKPQMVSSLSAMATMLAQRGVGRHIVARETRTVVVGDGTAPPASVSPAGLGVVTAHDALHAGEFHNRARDQVGLGTNRRRARRRRLPGRVALGVGGKGAWPASHNAIGLLARVVPSVSWNTTLSRRLNVGFERVLQVLVVEELRVVKAGAPPRARCRRRCSLRTSGSPFEVMRNLFASVPSALNSGK